MNLVDFSGYCVMDNTTNIRNLRREAIISADKQKWWHFLKKYKEFQSTPLIFCSSKISKSIQTSVNIDKLSADCNSKYYDAVEEALTLRHPVPSHSGMYVSHSK